MTDKTISNINNLDSDYFRLVYSRSCDYLNQFNIEDYWIYKVTKQQRRISVEEFYDFKYAYYIFFKKDKYDYKEIDEKLKLIFEKLTFNYLNKPPPSLYIIKKIKEKL